MKISQLSDTKLLISLCSEDMINFDLDFNKLSTSDPHSKKILSRLMTLACVKNSISTHNKSVILEAVPNDNGMLILMSLCEKVSKRKKYRIKRITQYPCYKFDNAETMLCAIEKLCDTDIFFYNNSAFFYKNRYYLVFDYPVVAKKARKILSEFAHSVKGTKPFVARLYECAKLISDGNAIVHIGSSL